MATEMTLICDNCAAIIDAGGVMMSAATVRARSRLEGTSFGDGWHDLCASCYATQKPGVANVI
jgi:hypothetical protein